ncbi:MAG: restriction endonuclease subunit S [Niabella sp.]
MDIKNFISILGFYPKENTTDIFIKKYQNDYCIEIDFAKQIIDYGSKIKGDRKTTQNFSQHENFVVLECVNRLLETGYTPENIILEKTWSAGHGVSKALDICVTREDGSEYLLIECKTYGKEFEKEFKRMKKEGGQLFTYFKFSNKSDLLMLYASKLSGEEIIYQNEIVKIEGSYRTGDVKDFYNSWNKTFVNFGVWENSPYDFKSKKFTKANLKELTETESTKIFHEFASILRKHSVSDKPNAFNKIFNLFLAKLYDEAKRENDELDFHWREDDNAVDFQVRLINLHKEGLYAFLEKEIEGIDEKDFQANSPEELLEKKKKVLKFNNILAIKEVLDDASFDENQRVLKDVVKLLEKYQIRYPRKQQHLSDFFEKLLTTGLKQEVGQYFTPPPITKFIVRSLPIKQMIEKEVNKETPELPAIIDYAAGSGHFITEAMEEYQDIIHDFTDDKMKDFFPKAKKQVKSWQADPYEWAAKYVYGIEKDYRLVKVAKVGCYFYGDGVAQVIHGDGLDSFKTSKTYKGLLQDNTNKPQFSLVLSNPPYSVNDCKDDLEYIGAQNEFDLYPYLTDKSKDIECLFVERTKHLLKDDGIAAVVLPSSILNNTGIQTKTRELILKYFNIVAIVELGGNTFMATNTNTVTLFLKRKSNQESIKLKNYVEKFFTEFIDNSINEIENPVSKYVNHVWENPPFSDYVSLLKKQPNQKVKESDLYKEYRKKIKAKKEEDFWNKLLETEKEKLLYFLLAYYQKDVVVVKSGEKDAEKRLLGYEFSNRRGSEGMHPIQRGKTIDDCTQLYNTKDINDLTKVSSYIYNAFIGNKNLNVAENLKSNISYADLVDMLTFDRVEFEKNISTSVKKKVKYENIWKTGKLVLLSDISDIRKGTSITKEKTKEGNIPVVAGGQEPAYFHNESNRDGNIITISASGAYSGFVNYFENPIFASDCNTIKSKDEKQISTKLIFHFLKSIQNEVYALQRGQAQPHVYAEDLANIKIPLPPLDIQQKIVSEIEVWEKKESKAKEVIRKLREDISEKLNYKEKTPIKLIAEINPNKTEFIKELDGELDVSFLSMADVSNEGDIINIQSKKLRDVKNGFTFFQDNDVLVAKITPCTENGKGALVLGMTNNIGFGSTEFFVLRANNKVLPKILHCHTQSVEFRKLAGDNMTGTSGHRRVPKSFIENYEIPLPPLSEQQKIVSEIENIESRITTLEKEIAAIPKQKEGILNKYL